MPAEMRAFVREWCKEQNSVSGANRWVIVAVAVGAIGLIVSSTITGFGILMTVGAVIAWYQFAPRLWDLNHLGSEMPVPDNLLEAIANASQVPLEAKAMLSERLRKQKKLYFGDIWDVEAQFRTKANEDTRTMGNGHKALLTYSKPDVKV